MSTQTQSARIETALVEELQEAMRLAAVHGNQHLYAAIGALKAFVPTEHREALINARQNRFLGIGAGDPPEYQSRLLLLAEYLFLLRGSEGFSVLVERLVSRPVAVSFFEAQAAATMVRAGFSISISRETGTKGNDFDFTASREGGHVSCEVTSIETANYAVSTLTNKLKKKVRQVPPDRAAVIFVTIPAQWIASGDNADQGIERLLVEARRFLTITRRVNAIILSWDQNSLLPTGQTVHANVCREAFNPNPRHAVRLTFNALGNSDELSIDSAIELAKRSSALMKFAENLPQ